MRRGQESGHFVQFFTTDGELVRAVSDFLLSGFDAGHTCVCVATASHREQIAARLATLGADPAALAAAYRYIPIDARTTLDSFMIRGCIDRERFHRATGLLVAQAASRGAPVRIFGEMVTLVAEQGLGQAVLELEELWNELSRQQPFTLFCGFPHGLFDQCLFQNVCAVHSHVVQAA
jgi:MEDS: MEthanogen/methylotroph, DcmR Sensory domain